MFTQIMLYSGLALLVYVGISRLVPLVWKPANNDGLNHKDFECKSARVISAYCVLYEQLIENGDEATATHLRADVLPKVLDIHPSKMHEEPELDDKYKDELRKEVTQ